MRALVGTVLLGIAWFAMGCGSGTPPLTQGSAPPGECMILAMNDTYRIESLPGGRGGMARMRALRKKLEADHPDLVLLHAGDFLFPSLLSNTYKGAQMVAALDLLDGSDDVDPRFFVTIGNHEFDKKDPSVLSARLAESRFTWLSSNVHFDSTVKVPEGRILPRTIVPCGGMRLGIFGETIGHAKPPYVASFDDSKESARAEAAALRKEGADVVVGLTHLALPMDVAILESLGAEGPDVIVGGHEHQRKKEWVGERAVFKADADAVSASVIRLGRADGKLRISHEWVDVKDPDVPEDPALKAWVDAKLREHEDIYCEKTLGLPAGSRCLAEKLGTAGDELVAEELEIRTFETNLGDWVADLMLGAFPDAKQRPDLAFVNSGALRLGLNIPKGEAITRRFVEELLPYPTELELIEITGETLQKVVERSVRQWTGQGHFLQIAGFAFEHDPKTEAASKLTLLGAAPRRIEAKDKLLAVTVDYLMNPSGDQDGYTMLDPKMVVAKGPDLKKVVLDALAALEKEGKALGPKVEGRICNTQRKGVCLAK